MFGGEKSGHIALLFSSKNKLSMPHPCPAHGGHVTKLVGSCDLIVPFSVDPEWTTTVQTALVSYGSDNMINVWCLKLNRGNQITLTLQMTIHTEVEPVHGKLTNSTVCFATLDNRVIMINTPRSHQPDGRIIATSHSLSRMSLLVHEAEEDHTSSIISLQCCPPLGLFATSSKDGHVKIWDSENHLASEINFGESLASVCFANSRGDLLVGFQKHISMIQAWDYLPDAVLKMNRDSPLIMDCIEQTMTFDPSLEFWYSSERTPCFPAEQESRRRCETDCNIDYPITSEGGQGSNVMSLSEAEMKASARSVQSTVDSCLAWELSQQYAAVLAAQSKLSCGDMRHHKVNEVKLSDVICNMETQLPFSFVIPQVLPVTAEATGTVELREGPASMCACTMMVTSSLPAVAVVGSSSGCLHQSASSGHLACVTRRRRGRERNKSPSGLQQQVSPMSTVSSKAEVLPLQFPSTKFPIAPDCKCKCLPE